MRKNIFGMNVKYKFDDLRSQGLEGYFNTQTKEIVLDKSLKGDSLKQVQIHEEFEAVFFRTTGHQLQMTQDAKEIMIDSFATWIVENYSLKQK